MVRQYVVVRFRASDARTYTYHNDGDHVFVGDEVMVPDNRGEGWKRVVVVDTTRLEPPFATKPISGKAPPSDPEAR